MLEGPEAVDLILRRQGGPIPKSWTRRLKRLRISFKSLNGKQHPPTPLDERGARGIFYKAELQDLGGRGLKDSSGSVHITRTLEPLNPRILINLGRLKGTMTQVRTRFAPS